MSLKILCDYEIVISKLQIHLIICDKLLQTFFLIFDDKINKCMLRKDNAYANKKCIYKLKVVRRNAMSTIALTIFTIYCLNDFNDFVNRICRIDYLFFRFFFFCFCDLFRAFDKILISIEFKQ